MTNTIGPPSSVPVLLPSQPLSYGRRVPLFGLHVTNADYPEAAGILDGLLNRRERARVVHFVNAHTLGHARRDASYHRALARAEHLFGDGTGVRWAIRALRDVSLRANLNGTDLVPYFMRGTAGRSYRLFMLGAQERVLSSAVDAVRRSFTGWEVCGFHHGFFDGFDEWRIVDRINRAEPHLLLVAMGNPKQELWIDRHLYHLDVPLSMGVGALFDYWAGTERRAPVWMRRAGSEWLYRMLFQRGKLKRYLLGNPEFLWIVAREKWRLLRD